jgi:hypothetical protein
MTATAPGPVAGFLAPIYLNTGSRGSPVWSKIDKAKGNEASESPDKVDVSAQYAAEKKYIPGQTDYSITFDYQYFKGVDDTIFDALRAAMKPYAVVEIAEADGPIAESGVVYSRADYFTSKMDKKADLGGSIIYSVELSPTISADGVVREKSWTTVA